MSKVKVKRSASMDSEAQDVVEDFEEFNRAGPGYAGLRNTIVTTRMRGQPAFGRTRNRSTLSGGLGQFAPNRGSFKNSDLGDSLQRVQSMNLR